MYRIKNLLISVVSFVFGIYFFYVGMRMTEKYGFSIFEDGGNPILTGHRNYDMLGEFILGFIVAIGGCISGVVHAYLFLKNTPDIDET